MKLEYLAKDSPIHRLHPLTILFLLLDIVFSCIIIPWTLYPIFLFLLIVLPLVLISRISRDYFNTFFKIVAPSVLFIFLMQSLFYPSTSRIILSINIIDITEESLLRGIKYSGRLMIFLSCGYIFIMTIHPNLLATCFEKYGFSRKVSYTIMVSLQMLPEFSSRFHTIVDAQKSKGLKITRSPISKFLTFKAAIYTFFMILLSSIPEREPLPLIRGFEWNIKKTTIIPIIDTRIQSYIRKIMLTLIPVLIAMRILSWL